MQDDLAGLIAPVAWLYERGDGYYTFLETQRWDKDRLGGCDNEALNYIETPLYPATALETLSRERDEARAEVETQGDEVVRLRIELADAAFDRDKATAQLTATQARLGDAVGLLADALTDTRDWQRRRFSFLAQQEGQSNA